MERLEELRLEQERLKTEVERLRGEKEAAEEPERLAKEEHEKVGGVFPSTFAGFKNIALCVAMGGGAGSEEGSCKRG